MTKSDMNKIIIVSIIKAREQLCKTTNSKEQAEIIERIFNLTISLENEIERKVA